MATGASMKTAVIWFLRILLCGTFVYAGASKLLDPQAFASDIGHYRLLPYPLAIALALYLPWLELLCGLAVTIRQLEYGALTLILGMCLTFAGALASAWWRGLDISCGCFGHDTLVVVPWALARVVMLAVLAFWLNCGGHRKGQSRQP